MIVKVRIIETSQSFEVTGESGRVLARSNNKENFKSIKEFLKGRETVYFQSTWKEGVILFKKEVTGYHF